MFSHKESLRKIHMHQFRPLIGRPGPLEAFFGIGKACLGIAYLLGSIVALEPLKNPPGKRLGRQGVAANSLCPATSSINNYPTPFTRTPVKRVGSAFPSLRIRQ